MIRLRRWRKGTGIGGLLTHSYGSKGRVKKKREMVAGGLAVYEQVKLVSEHAWAGLMHAAEEGACSDWMGVAKAGQSGWKNCKVEVKMGSKCRAK